jgi:hypothetical protein
MPRLRAIMKLDQDHMIKAPGYVIISVMPSQAEKSLLACNTYPYAEFVSS